MSAIVSYQPQNIEQLDAFAKRLAASGIVPTPYRGKPNDILVACLWGWETAELTPMTSLAYIDVIQGRAAYKSEALVGIALRKGYILDVEEEFVGKPGTDEYAAVCTVTKKNGKTLTRKFSVGDAKKAGLYGKDNWNKWLDRMLIARARGFAVRDAAPSSMLSYSAEEVRDFDPDPPPRSAPRDITPVSTTTEPAPPTIEAKPEPSPAVESEMNVVVKIVGQDGSAHYTGSIAREALVAYGNAKKRSTDPAMVAASNLDSLRAILPFVRNGNRDKLEREIQAAEAVVERLELERRAIDDAEEVDEDGVVRDRRAEDDDGEPLAAAPED